MSHGAICILIHPDYKITDANGKEWWFEMHPYCGPSVMTKKGDVAARQPSEKSPFWDAFAIWAKEHLPPPPAHNGPVIKLDIKPSPRKR